MPNYLRYILRQLVGPLVVVTASFTAMIWLTQSLRFIDLIVNKGLSIGVFLELTILLVPSLLVVVLPAALLAAILYAYHRMSVDSELVIFRAAGMSNIRIATPALALSLVLAAASYLVTLYLMPLGFRSFKDLQFEIRHNYATVLLQEGVFNTPFDGLTVYVRARSEDGELQGILIHDEREPDQPVSMMAERGALVSTDQGPRFVLLHGNRQLMDHDDGNLSVLYFDRYSFDIDSPGASGDNRLREAQERFPGELLFPEHGLDGKQYREFLAEFHQRMLAPLLNCVLALIGVASIIIAETGRRSHVVRILVAAVSATLVQAVLLALTSLSVQLPGIAALLYLVFALTFVLGIYVLRMEQPRLFAVRPQRAAPA